MQKEKNNKMNPSFKINWLIAFPITLLMMACAGKANEASENKGDENSVLYFEGGYSTVNGIKMYYEIYGQGEPLVLLHGGGSTIQSSFGRIIPKLAEQFKIVALELQNHGRSDQRSIPETFTQDADDVFALLQNLKIDKANFLGFSNGGETLFELSDRHPEIINRLIIASSPFNKNGFQPGFFDGVKAASLTSMPAQLKEEFLKVNADTARLRIMFERDRQRMVDFTGWTDDQIKSIAHPTLVINGDKDVMTIENAIELHRLIANSQLAILPGLHGEYMGEVTTLSEEKPFSDTCTPLIINFLKSNNQK